MFQTFRHWLADVPVADPVQRQVAPLVQIAEISGIVMTLLTMPLTFFSSEPSADTLLKLSINGFVLIATVIALALMRHGRFMASMVAVTSVVMLSLAIRTMTADLHGTDGIILLGFAIPIVMASLLLGRQGLLPVLGMSYAIVIGAALLAHAPDPSSSAGGSIWSNVASFVLTFAVLGIFLDRFGESLRNALTAALQREQELEQVRAGLAEQVAQQTATLQAALETSEQREQRLADMVHELQATEALVRELSAPVIPVLHGVLVTPLVGELDHIQVRALLENVLGAVEHRRAHTVIFDVTGMPVVDTHVAHTLVGAAATVRLLGARAVLVGIRPDVAQTLVLLGCDLSTITTYTDLETAIEAMVQRRVADRARRVERALPAA